MLSRGVLYGDSLEDVLVYLRLGSFCEGFNFMASVQKGRGGVKLELSIFSRRFVETFFLNEIFLLPSGFVVTYVQILHI